MWGPSIPLSGRSNRTLSLGKTSLHPSLLFRLRKHATITYHPHTQKDANNYSDWGSHARGCTSKLQNKLNEQYEVKGFVQPGAGIKKYNNCGKIWN